MLTVQLMKIGGHVVQTVYLDHIIQMELVIVFVNQYHRYQHKQQQHKQQQRHKRKQQEEQREQQQPQ